MLSIGEFEFRTLANGGLNSVSSPLIAGAVLSLQFLSTATIPLDIESFGQFVVNDEPPAYPRPACSGGRTSMNSLPMLDDVRGWEDPFRRARGAPRGTASTVAGVPSNCKGEIRGIDAGDDALAPDAGAWTGRYAADLARPISP